MSNSEVKSHFEILGKPAIDVGAIQKIRALDRPGEPSGAFLRELLEIFKETTPSVIAKLSEAAKVSDVRMVESLSHKLKGICRNVAAQRLSELSELIETQSRRGTIVPTEVIDTLAPEYDTATHELEDILDPPPVSAQNLDTEKGDGLKKKSDSYNSKEKIIDVLLIEDSQSDAFLVMDALQEPYEQTSFKARRVSTLSDAIASLETSVFDVILLDLGLPDSHGLETFLTICEVAPNCPVIVLSGSIDNKVAAQTLEHGAQDYLPKQEISRVSLTKTISYALARWQLTEVERKQAAAERQRIEKMSQMKSQFWQI